MIPSIFFPTTPFTKEIIRICFEPYAEQLYINYQKLKSINGNFTFGLKKTDQINLFLAHQSILSQIKHEESDLLYLFQENGFYSRIQILGKAPAIVKSPWATYTMKQRMNSPRGIRLTH